MTHPLTTLRLVLGLTLFAVVAVILLPLYLARFGRRAWLADFRAAMADFALNTLLWRRT